MGSTVYDCIPVDDCLLTCMKELEVFFDKAAGREFGFPGEPSVISKPRNNKNTDGKRMAFGLTETLLRITDSYIFTAVLARVVRCLESNRCRCGGIRFRRECPWKAYSAFDVHDAGRSAVQRAVGAR